MKRILVLMLIVTGLFFAACDDDDDKSAAVRFQNGLSGSDACILHGIRLGSAEYKGRLCPGEVTDYFEVEEGGYVVQLYDGANWLTDTASKFNVSGGKTYTIHLSGTVTSRWYRLIEE